MNQRDRDRLARLYGATRWPWFNRGRTVDVADLSGFARRMSVLEPLYRDAIMAISLHDREDADGELDADAALDDLDRALREMAWPAEETL